MERFRAAVLGAEGELSAAAIAPLSTPELGSIIRLVAQLALEVPRDGTEGDRWNALSSSLGRRARRRVRKARGEIDAAALASIDFEAWRAELRGLASARVMESTDIEFRLALTAWLQTADSGDGDTADAIPPEADVSQLVTDRPEARALLRSVVNAWVEAL